MTPGTSKKHRALPKYVHQTPSGKYRVVIRGSGEASVDHLGTFDTVGQAVDSVMGAVGESTPKTRISRNAVEVLKALSMPFEDWVPADLAHLITFRKENGHFRSAPGPLYLIAILGKEDGIHHHRQIRLTNL